MRDQASPRMESPRQLLLDNEDRRGEIRKGEGGCLGRGSREEGEDERLSSLIPPDIMSQMLLFADGATLSEAQLVSKVSSSSARRQPMPGTTASHLPSAAQYSKYLIANIEYCSMLIWSQHAGCCWWQVITTLLRNTAPVFCGLIHRLD